MLWQTFLYGILGISAPIRSRLVILSHHFTVELDRYNCNFFSFSFFFFLFLILRHSVTHCVLEIYCRHSKPNLWRISNISLQKEGAQKNRFDPVFSIFELVLFFYSLVPKSNLKSTTCFFLSLLKCKNNCGYSLSSNCSQSQVTRENLVV